MMKVQVRHGFGAMPEFSEEEMTGEELDALMTYLQSLRKAPLPTLAHSAD